MDHIAINIIFNLQYSTLIGYDILYDIVYKIGQRRAQFLHSTGCLARPGGHVLLEDEGKDCDPGTSSTCGCGGTAGGRSARSRFWTPWKRGRGRFARRGRGLARRSSAGGWPLRTAPLLTRCRDSRRFASCFAPVRATCQCARNRQWGKVKRRRLAARDGGGQAPAAASGRYGRRSCARGTVIRACSRWFAPRHQRFALVRATK